MTASIGIFPKDGGKTAPAAVIGFQIHMRDLYNRFIALTSLSRNSSMNCSHNWTNCYLLDQNGYVVISKANKTSGQFMGTQEGAVMNSMVHQGLYNPVEIYDYQAWCEEVVSNIRPASSRISYLEIYIFDTANLYRVHWNPHRSIIKFHCRLRAPTRTSYPTSPLPLSRVS